MWRKAFPEYINKNVMLWSWSYDDMMTICQCGSEDHNHHKMKTSSRRVKITWVKEWKLLVFQFGKKLPKCFVLVPSAILVGHRNGRCGVFRPLWRWIFIWIYFHILADPIRLLNKHNIFVQINFLESSKIFFHQCMGKWMAIQETVNIVSSFWKLKNMYFKEFGSFSCLLNITSAI